MNTLDEDAPAHDAGGKTDVLVQVILGFFLPEPKADDAV